MGAEFFLKDAVEGQLGDYDVVLIDCPPQLGKLTPNALFAATEVLIPISVVDRGAYNGAAELLARVEDVRRRQELVVSALVRTHAIPSAGPAERSRSRCGRSAPRSPIRRFRCARRSTTRVWSASRSRLARVGALGGAYSKLAEELAGRGAQKAAA